MKELLMEIGTEEIPAGFVSQALIDLERLARKELEANRINFEGVKTLGTPRRLVLVVESVSEKQKDVELKKLGPSKQAAFDSGGKPTKAAIGFAKSQAVPVESLELIETEKGTYVAAVKREAGKPTLQLLSAILPRLILSIPFQKSMRWADVSIRFARPIHWILALFGGETIPFEIGMVQSSNVTYGHRFMHPGPIQVNDFRSYLQKTREASIIVDPAERKKMIEDMLVSVAASASGMVLRDEELLNEVNFLVEYPVALCGSFGGEFLSLPREVVIHSMKEHQRYFPVVDDHGGLLPYFVFVSNIAARNSEVVVKGNERVLQARLSDAAYFFHDDLKIPLEKRVEQLKKVVFQAKLGTSYEKVMRFKQLALFICGHIDPKLQELVERASFLCKADLVTGMVGEFSKLQGIVGREYALLSGEKTEVAEAIYEHYLPGFAGDRLPSSPVGDIVSMADRLDTIVGCFGVGLVPTGTADPFGLRRHALGIIRIILEKKYSLSLRQLIEESGNLLKQKMERSFVEVKKEVLDFFRARYQNLFLDRGYPLDVLEAVFSVSFDDLLDVRRRIDALNRARNLEDIKSIVIAFKRAMNILKAVPSEKKMSPTASGRKFRLITIEPHPEVGATQKKGIDPSLFSEPAEHNLYKSFQEVEAAVKPLLRDGFYDGSIDEMTKMRGPIDDFFNGVMVMVKDEAVRNNRLALLDEIGQLFLKVADFSKLA